MIEPGHAFTLDRIAALEDALADILNRDSRNLYVTSDGGQRYLAVSDSSDPDCHVLFSLWDLARDLERKLQ